MTVFQENVDISRADFANALKEAIVRIMPLDADQLLVGGRTQRWSSKKDIGRPSI